MRSLIFLTLSSIALATLAAPARSGPDNIAPAARAEASAVFSGAYSADGVNDGRIAISDQGEWASNSRMNIWGGVNYPWIQLSWDEPQLIDKVILYDRASLETHTGGGKLVFSDGGSVIVTTIPNDGTAKVVKFPVRCVTSVRFVVTDGHGPNLGLSEMEVYPARAGLSEPVELVDPYIETTRGRYFFFVTGSRPFGMISAAPMTRNKNQMGGGYNFNSTEILSFPQVHAWTLSGIEFMPTTGGVDPTDWQPGWKSEFSHDSEIVQPGYHRVFLDRYKSWIEQTCTDRSSIYRITYTEDAEADLLINLGGYVATSTMTGATARRVSDTEIEGSIESVGRLWGGPPSIKIFFVARFQKPFEKISSWNGDRRTEDFRTMQCDSLPPARHTGYRDAPTAGLAAGYTVSAGDSLQIKFAVSYTSVENARHNLDSDFRGAGFDEWDFDAIRKDAWKDWNQWMNRIQVAGGSPNQRVKFYTDLWHVLLGRHKLDDASGDYPDYTVGNRLQVRTLPIDGDGQSRFHMYNSDAFWLTQWNLNILWGLAWPEVLDDFAACLVQYADNGGKLPRGPVAGGYTHIMTGCPATNLITSAFQQGVLSKTDPQHAVDMMKRNHMPGGMLDIDQHYLDKGWLAGSAGRTIEANFQDWSLARMAAALGRREDASYFVGRSVGWRKLYNADVGLIMPRNADGKWMHQDPLSGTGWVEANAWQATWSVSHDISALAELMGGQDQLCHKLNHAFEQSADTDFVYGYGKGYISYANQPGCSNAHVFNHAGKPWLSQYWVRRVNQQAYGAANPNEGYGGHDEDQGQMGGVSALMSLGLFSLRGLASRTPIYEITSPVFDKIVIQLNPTYFADGQFIIRTHGNSDENVYIQRAKLNGKEHSHCWIYQRDVTRGGTLDIWLGPRPNQHWGNAKPAPQDVK